MGHVAQLIRETPRDAWLLGGAPALLTSHDGGATWRALRDPCGSPDHLMWPTGVAVLPPHHLWLLCGGEPSAGNQDKAFYGSADGGQHWHELACAGGWFTPCPAQGVGTLPSGGYVWQLFMLSTRRGVVTLGRGNLLATDDGGRNWTEPAPTLRDLGGAGYLGRATFVDPRHGWLAATCGVYRTTDGGRHWRVAVLSRRCVRDYAPLPPTGM